MIICDHLHVGNYKHVLLQSTSHLPTVMVQFIEFTGHNSYEVYILILPPKDNTDIQYQGLWATTLGTASLPMRQFRPRTTTLLLTPPRDNITPL